MKEKEEENGFFCPFENWGWNASVTYKVGPFTKRTPNTPNKNTAAGQPAAVFQSFQGRGGVSLGIVMGYWTDTPSVTVWLLGCAQSRLRQYERRWTGNQTCHNTKNWRVTWKIIYKPRLACALYLQPFTPQHFVI